MTGKKSMMIEAGVLALLMMAGGAIAGCPSGKCGAAKADKSCSAEKCDVEKAEKACPSGGCPVMKAKASCASAKCGHKKGDADCPSGMCAAGAAMKAKPESAKHEAKYSIINTKALATLLRSGTDVVLLDARSAKWDDGRRLPGAKAMTDKASEKEAMKLIGGKDKLVVAYCTNLKCPASKRLANKLVELGFENVMKYPEGIDEWEAKGHKVEKVKK